jgi:hypothetical protein
LLACLRACFGALGACIGLRGLRLRMKTPVGP